MIRKWTVILILTFGSILQLAAETYYVRVNGNDQHCGTRNSDTHAWQTLNYAFGRLQGGDTLWIHDGLYLVDPLVLQDVHGSEESPVFIGAMNRWQAKIRLKDNPEFGNTIVASSCSYLEFDGLEVYGEAPNTGTGIEIDKGSHHVTVRNCYVHDCGCGGISGRGSDYITVENNVVRGNATRSKWNCSGISFLLARNYDDQPGYHMIIRGNVCYENECRFPFEHGGFDVPTDGNGIILDLFNNKIKNSEGEPGGYRSHTLIENNLSFKNGGRGINVFRSDNVTIRNNTTWHNGYVLSAYSEGRAEIESYEAGNLEWYNNLVIQDPGLPMRASSLHSYGTAPIRSGQNLFIGQTHFWPEMPEGIDDVVLDKKEQDHPMLLFPQADIPFSSIGDFSTYFGLREGSPAIDAANTHYPGRDLNGDPRPRGEAADLGCYEFVGPDR